LVALGESANRGKAFAYHYNIRPDNWNGRTLQLFSTSAGSTMRSCPTCPFHADFQKFYDYYGNTSYANAWVMGAFFNSTTTFVHGSADFSVYTNKTALAECVLKGSVYLNVLMELIHELENAIDGCVNHASEPVQHIDIAMAYYAGSIEALGDSANGAMFYNLANKRALTFRTCGPSSNRVSGTSYINLHIVREFKAAQGNVRGGSCDAARDNKEKIVNLMKVPLVQGLLEYAYIRDYTNPLEIYESEKVNAIGATFAAAILPFLHACNQADASAIYDYMKVGSSADSVDFTKIKSTLERNYDCLGISCPQVGGIYVDGEYAVEGTPCTVGTVEGPSTVDPSSGGGGGSKAGAGIGWTLFVCLGLVVGFMAFRRIKRRSKSVQKNVEIRPTTNLAAISEIA
jgi:hypothetical protein